MVPEGVDFTAKHKSIVLKNGDTKEILLEVIPHKRGQIVI